MRVVLSAATAERAAAVAAGDQEAVPLSPAATVVLLRETPSTGVEIYLQRRHHALAFAGGMYAFPGGRVDPADGHLADHLWAGPSPAQWGAMFGAGDLVEARAHVVGVVRELFEETGVLLARPARDQSSWPGEAERRAVSEGRPLADVLDQHGLAVDTAALTAWSRWVTPRLERRRFDAWFFVAALPKGQHPRAATDESHEGRWVAPRDVLSQHVGGELAMLPPTWWTVRELASARDVADARTRPPAMVRHTVGWTRDGDDVVMVMPDDPAYPGDDPREGL